MKLFIVMYHYVRDLGRSRYPAIKGLETNKFITQIQYLYKNFTIIRMEDLLNAINGGALPDRPALLTFDDGYIDNYVTVLPILDNYGLQGSFFAPSLILESNKLLEVNKIHIILASGDHTSIYKMLIDEIDYYRGTEFDIPETKYLLDKYAALNRFDTAEIIFIKQMLQRVLPEKLREIITDKLFCNFVGVAESVLAKELYCNIGQLRVMKKMGMFIGVHGDSHKWLGDMDKIAYEKDLKHSIDTLGDAGLIDEKSWVISYPSGSWNKGVIEFVKMNNGVAGLTTEVRVADLGKDDCLLLPRLDTNDFPPVSENYFNVQ